MNKFLIAAAFFAGTLGCMAADSTPMTLAQTPPAVQRAIAAQLGKGTLEDITKSGVGEETYYDVDVTTGTGAEGGFTIGADGALLSVEVALSETPAAVQKTILAQTEGWELGGINKDRDGGDTTYDVEASKGTETQEFSVDNDGTLLSMGLELGQAPDTIKNAIQAEAHGGEIESIDKNMDDGSYDVEIAANGVEKTFTLGSDGTLESAGIALAEAPAAVQTTIGRQAPGGAVQSIDQNFDPDGITFDVVATGKNRANNSFTVGPDGTLLSVEVTLAQVPPPARKTIESQIGTGKIIRIDHELVDMTLGVLPYDVEGRKDGKPFDFSVGPKGRFLGMDDQ